MGIGGALLGDLELLLTTRVIRRQSLFRMIGPASQCHQAENEIEQMYPGMRCLLLPSATIGLSLVLELLDLGPRREILISPFGWVSNWSCITRAGHVPRFVPLDAQLQWRVEDLVSRINERTGAVIVSHMMGRGQQRIGDIARVCAERGIPLLEDVAQSFGVSVQGRRAGTFGAAAWCSLNHHKILSTGDGGFALAAHESVFARLCARHDQGHIMRDGKRRAADVQEPGLSLRVNELTGAVLRAQLARYHLMKAKILLLHEALSESCRSMMGLDLLPPNDGDVPFTVMFRRPQGLRYPSLAESGLHVASNVPWLARTWETAVRDEPALAATLQTLADTAAIGAGFVDPYYAVPLGLQITDRPADARRLFQAFEHTVTS